MTTWWPLCASDILLHHPTLHLPTLAGLSHKSRVTTLSSSINTVHPCRSSSPSSAATERYVLIHNVQISLLYMPTIHLDRYPFASLIFWPIPHTKWPPSSARLNILPTSLLHQPPRSFSPSNLQLSPTSSRFSKELTLSYFLPVQVDKVNQRGQKRLITKEQWKFLMRSRASAVRNPGSSSFRL